MFNNKVELIFTTSIYVATCDEIDIKCILGFIYLVEKAYLFGDSISKYYFVALLWCIILPYLLKSLIIIHENYVQIFCTLNFFDNHHMVTISYWSFSFGSLYLIILFCWICNSYRWKLDTTGIVYYAFFSLYSFLDVDIGHYFFSFFFYYWRTHPLVFLLNRMDRQKREEEIKNRSSKKAVDAEQSLLNRVHIILFTVALAECLFFSKQIFFYDLFGDSFCFFRVLVFLSKPLFVIYVVS